MAILGEGLRASAGRDAAKALRCVWLELDSQPMQQLRLSALGKAPDFDSPEGDDNDGDRASGQGNGGAMNDEEEPAARTLLALLSPVGLTN